MSLGQAPPAEDGHARDPEELVEEDQELVRCGGCLRQRSCQCSGLGRGSTSMGEAACCCTFHLLAPLTISGSWQSE